MAENFTSLVEQATGRTVRVFLSETDIDSDVSVETFLLAEERTDMTGSRNVRAPAQGSQTSAGRGTQGGEPHAA
jgi:hypothetical protein